MPESTKPMTERDFVMNETDLWDKCSSIIKLNAQMVLHF